MDDRLELLEAALDCLPDGFALMNSDANVAYWNRAAEAITGYSSAEVLGRRASEALEAIVVGGVRQWVNQTNAQPAADSAAGRGSLVHVHHRLGHELPAMVRVLVLRDGLGARIGTAALFHPAERLDALPHGDSGEAPELETNQAQLQERLEAEFEDFTRGQLALGVLWITVDQGQNMHKTHGARACEAMMEIVGRVLAGGLRPGEEIGRWGESEFLIVSHERTAEMLGCHGQVLMGLARTADFRWWGDRVSLTVSIGAAQAEPKCTLAELLERARAAMRASIHAGGNHVTNAAGRSACSPS
jgi:diguanylate cyclase (GGDEF)-like protein/PAS domain S-box-containing protein